MSNKKIVKVNITFRNTEATEAIRSHATEKVTHTLSKFIHQDTEAHVVLRVEKNRHIAEISLRTDGADFICKEESGDLYASIDLLADALAQQMRKHKEKLTSHH